LITRNIRVRMLRYLLTLDSVDDQLRDLVQLAVSERPEMGRAKSQFNEVTEAGYSGNCATTVYVDSQDFAEVLVVSMPR